MGIRKWVVAKVCVGIVMWGMPVVAWADMLDRDRGGVDPAAQEGPSVRRGGPESPVSLAVNTQEGENQGSASNLQADNSASQERQGFISRFFNAYREGLTGTAEAGAPGPETVRRLPPSPWSSPPFPMSEHIGPVIGVSDTTPNNLPLMKALADTEPGKALTSSRINIYGWIVPSVNLSTSRDTNIPLTYTIYPNSVQLSQAVLNLERGLDTAQTSHLDWGFRSTHLFGSDYRWTAAKGVLSEQLFDHNQLYGYDPMEFYGQVYIPWVAEGMVLKVGRFMSPADIEAQLAPNNYLVTHSVMFSYDPFTFMGALATIRLHPQWTIELGVHGGNDMAVWSESAQPNGHAMVKWSSADNQDAVWFGANSVGSGQFTKGHDNLQHMVATWSHRFNDTFHMMTEAYYEYQYNAAKGGNCNFGPTKPYASAGGCGPTIPGISDAFGAVNYFQIKLSDMDYMAIRNDVLADFKGQRTGFKTVYTSHTIGWSHWLSNELIVRPEIRYDHSWTDVTPYDNGTRQDQFAFIADFIIKY